MLFQYYILINNVRIQKRGWIFLECLSYHSHDPLLRLQRWQILNHIHAGRDCSNLWFRSHSAKDKKIKISDRSFQINFPMLYDNIQHPRCFVYDLQGKQKIMQGYLPNDTTGDVIFRIQ